MEHLPGNIEVLTRFGERADVAPDNKSTAFMAKTFGDAMVINLQTRNITCLTCGIPAAAFLRVMHLFNSDYLLIGPEHFENAEAGKSESELWYLNKKKGSRPVKLGVKLSEGVAVSKKGLKIAYTQSDATPGIGSQIIVAGLDLSSPSPKIINQKQYWKARIKAAVWKRRISLMMISSLRISATYPTVHLK